MHCHLRLLYSMPLPTSNPLDPFNTKWPDSLTTTKVSSAKTFRYFSLIFGENQRTSKFLPCSELNLLPAFERFGCMWAKTSKELSHMQHLWVNMKDLVLLFVNQSSSKFWWNVGDPQRRFFDRLYHIPLGIYSPWTLDVIEKTTESIGLQFRL